jgi:flavorubredoxin
MDELIEKYEEWLASLQKQLKVAVAEQGISRIRHYMPQIVILHAILADLESLNDKSNSQH